MLDPSKLKFKHAQGSKTWRFKNWFLREIEKILNARPQVTPNRNDNIKIVDSVFAFKNSILIKKLIARGKHIVADNKDKLDQADI